MLELPTLSQLIFPAMLHIEVDNSLLLNSSEQFDLSLLPQKFWREHGISLSLYGENGVELYTTIQMNSMDITTPNVLGLRFRSEHLQENIISLETLKSLFEEIVPSFHVDFGLVYERQASRRLNPIYQPQKNVPMRYFEDSRGKRYVLEFHWINFFGRYILDSLGRERFTGLHTYSEKYELHDGIVVVLQNTPYDDADPEHRQRLRQAEAELQFKSLEN
jgi:hypothetical protein